MIILVCESTANFPFFPSKSKQFHYQMDVTRFISYLWQVMKGSILKPSVHNPDSYCKCGACLYCRESPNNHHYHHQHPWIYLWLSTPTYYCYNNYIITYYMTCAVTSKLNVMIVNKEQKSSSLKLVFINMYPLTN